MNLDGPDYDYAVFEDSESGAEHNGAGENGARKGVDERGTEEASATKYGSFDE